MKILQIVIVCWMVAFSGHAETVIVSLKSNAAEYWQLLARGIKESAPSSWDVYWASPQYAQGSHEQHIMLSALPVTPDAIILAPIDIAALSTELAEWHAAGIPVVFVDHKEHADATTALYHDESIVLTLIGDTHPAITHMSLAANPPQIPPGQAMKFNAIQHNGKGAIPGNDPVFIDTHQVPLDLYDTLAAREQPVYMQNISAQGYNALKHGILAGVLQRDQYAMGQKAVDTLVSLFNGDTVPEAIAVPVEYITAENRVSQIQKIFRVNVE